MNHFGVWCFTVLFWSITIPSSTHALIYVYSYKYEPFWLFDDLPASFGASVPKDGLVGTLVLSHPLNGCTTMKPPPSSTRLNPKNFIVLIRRNDCNFDVKVLNAQQAGYKAAIVHNVYSDTLLKMNISNASVANQILIPSVFTSEYASTVIKQSLNPESEISRTYVILEPDYPPRPYKVDYLVLVMSLMFSVAFIIWIVICVQHIVKLKKNRLSKKQLKWIPTHKFHKGDDYDECAICLDDYEENDRLRVLPCSHAYHCKCVDQWLTKTKKTCPLCKQGVTRNNPEHSESNSKDDSQEPREEQEVPSEVDA